MEHLLNIWKLTCGFRKFKLTHGKVGSGWQWILLFYHRIFSVLGKPNFLGLSLAGDVYCFTGWRICYRLIPIFYIAIRIVCSILLSSYPFELLCHLLGCASFHCSALESMVDVQLTVQHNCGGMKCGSPRKLKSSALGWCKVDYWKRSSEYFRKWTNIFFNSLSLLDCSICIHIMANFLL